MKVLVVDDEGIVLESCKRVLGEDEFQVTTARSAGEAMEALGKEAFSLVLMDIKMPGRDGISLMREMKERYPKIPVIVMSGYATPETVHEVSRMNAATFIAKPFTPDELLSAVRLVIQAEVQDGEAENPGH